MLRDALVGRCFDSELVVASAQVLHEGVPGDNHTSGVSGTVALRRHETFRAAARRRMGDLSREE